MLKRKREMSDDEVKSTQIKIVQDRKDHPFKQQLIDRKNEVYDVTKLINYDFKREYLLDCELVTDHKTISSQSRDE